MLPSPLGLPALALLASTGDPGQNTRTSTPRAGLAAYYACAGPPLLANRSVGKAGRPYAAPGGVGGNQGRGVLGRGRGCGSCQVAATQALCGLPASFGKLVQQNMGDCCAQATWACSVVLASGAVRGQCPGRVQSASGLECISCVLLS